MSNRELAAPLFIYVGGIDLVMFIVMVAIGDALKAIITGAIFLVLAFLWWKQ